MRTYSCLSWAIWLSALDSGLRCGEDGFDLGVYCGPQWYERAIEVDGAGRTGFQGAQELQEWQSGPVLNFRT